MEITFKSQMSFENRTNQCNKTCFVDHKAVLQEKEEEENGMFVNCCGLLGVGVVCLLCFYGFVGQALAEPAYITCFERGK